MANGAIATVDVVTAAVAVADGTDTGTNGYEVATVVVGAADSGAVQD